MNYWQHILSSNYWHIVYEIVVINSDGLWQISHDVFFYRAEVKACDIAID